MGFKDVSKRSTAANEQRQTDKEYPFEPLRDRATQLFPNGHVARIARHFNVQTRTVQKWMSGELQAPDDIVAWIDHQLALAQKLKIHEIEDWARENLDRGQDKEVVAAWISELYHQLIGDHPK